MSRLDLDDIRRRAGNLEWAAADEPWDYFADAQPDSAYAEWVRLLSPRNVLELLDEIAPTTVGGTDG